MNSLKTLQNNTGYVAIARAQMHATRTMMGVSLLVTTVLNYVDYNRIDSVNNGSFATYVNFKFLLVIIGIVVFIGSFVVPSLKKNFIDFSVFVYLALFYALSAGAFFDSANWSINYTLIAIAMFVFASNVKLSRVVLFTVASNAMLIFITINRYSQSGIIEFMIVYIITSVCLTMVKVLRNRLDNSIVQVDRLFEEIFNSMRDAIFLLDPSTQKIVFNNKSADKMFGANVEIQNFIAPEYQNTFFTAIKMIFEFKGTWEGELQLQDKKGKFFFSMVSLSYFRMQSAELLFMKIVDITKLKDSDRQLKEVLLDVQDKNKQLEESKRAIMNILEDVVSERAEATAREQKLDAVLQSIVEGVIVLDANHRVYLYNDAALRMLQLKADQVNNHHFSEVLDFRNEITGESINNFIDEVFQGKVVDADYNSVLKRKDGTVLPVNETASPIYNDQNQVQRVVIVIRDATELRKIDKMRSEFVSVASHQLRTPLTSINWYVELLNDPGTNGNLTDIQKESIDRIGEGNHRMINLVNDLLNISRIETGKNLNLIFKPSDFVSLVQEVIQEQQIIAAKRGISIRFDNMGIETLPLNIDREKMRQVVMNLLSNAVKYSFPSNEVLLKIGKDNEYLYLDFVDHGIGIPEAQQERVFEKFFRAENAVTQQTEGTGLGTYISRSIAQAHGGDVFFYSKQNEGTTFTLKIPLFWQPAIVSEVAKV